MPHVRRIRPDISNHERPRLKSRASIPAKTPAECRDSNKTAVKAKAFEAICKNKTIWFKVEKSYHNL